MCGTWSASPLKDTLQVSHIIFHYVHDVVSAVHYFCIFSALAKLGLQIKVVNQKSRSNVKNHVLTSLLPCFKDKGKVRDRGQG